MNLFRERIAELGLSSFHNTYAAAKVEALSKPSSQLESNDLALQDFPIPPYRIILLTL